MTRGSLRDMGGSQRSLRQAIDQLDGPQAAAPPARRGSRAESRAESRALALTRRGPWIVVIVLTAAAVVVVVSLLAA